MKINMKPPNSSEYLSKEILEKDFIKVFSTFHMIQKIMGVSRVDARDRFVTAPSIPQKIYTIIYCIFIILTSCIIFKFNCYTPNSRLYYLAATEAILVVFCSLCNAIHARFLNKDDNVAFYIKMQEIDRLMDINHCKPINTRLFKIHMFTIISMAGVAMLMFIITLCIRTELVFGLLGLVITYGNFMLEIAYGSNLIVYFFLRVRFINASIDNHIQAQPINVYTTPNSDLKFLASKSCNFKTSDTDVYLERIFECFLKYQDLYRFQVFILFAGFIVFWGLGTQIVIDGIQTNVLGLLEWLVILTMCLIAYVMLIFLCLRLQVLYMDIKETKRLCVRVMSIYYDGPIREKAKKMYKLIQENASRFSVYDMWYVDASIIITMLGLMTSLFVTLLQFAYL